MTQVPLQGEGHVPIGKSSLADFYTRLRELARKVRDALALKNGDPGKFDDLLREIDDDLEEVPRPEKGSLDRYDLWRWLKSLRQLAVRARAEEEVRRSQSELADFFENAPVGLHRVGPDGKVLWVNRAELDLLGYTREEYIGRHIADFHADKEAIVDILRRLQAGEVLHNYQARLLCKDGSEKHVILDSNALWEDGRIIHTRCFTRDITEWKRTKDDRERLWKYSRDMLCVAGFDGFFKDLNPAWEKTLGFTREELKARPYLDFVHRDDREKTRAEAESLQTGAASVAFENRYCCGDGTYKWLSWNAVPIPREHTIYAVAYDITERKRAEEVQSRLAAIVSSSIDAIIFKKLDGTIVDWNRGAERLYGYSAEEAVGQSIALLVPSELRGELAGIMERIKRGECVGPLETTRVRKDGREVRVSVTTSPVKDGEGRLIGASAITRDITERKRADRRLEAQLAATIILADSATLAEATPGILQAVCTVLGWSFGAVWRVDREARVLRCVETWRAPSAAVPEFEAISRGSTFERGVGMPGRVWASGEPAWINDVTEDSNFPRARIAAQEGLHAAFGFPIRLGAETLGVFEFFSHEIEQPDTELLQMLTIIGGQFGQFIERKRAEEALTRERNQLRTLIDHLPDSVYFKDKGGRFVINNAAHLQILGASVQEETKGKTDFDFFDVELAKQYDDDDQMVIQSGQPLLGRIEPVVGKSRKGRLFSTSKIPLPGGNGEVVGLVGISRDVTEQTRLAAIVESSDDAIFSTCRESIIRTWNPGAERIYGYSASEAIGEPISLLDPPDRVGELRGILEQIQRGEPAKPLEMVHERNRRKVYVSVTFSPLKDGEGRLIGASAIARDITERKRAEEERGVMQALATAGLTVAWFAHDAGKILRVLAPNADSVQQAFPSLVEDVNWQEFRTNLEFMNSFTQSTMECLSLKEGTLELRREKLHPIVEDAWELCRRFFLEKADVGRVEFLNECHESHMVPINRLALTRILMNCIKNSRDAIIPLAKKRVNWRGTIRVTSCPDPCNPERLLALSVCDDGGGISRDLLDQLAGGQFFHTTKGDKGTGLGMYLVAALARKMNGRVLLASSTEASGGFPAGTVVSLCLPTEGTIVPTERESDPPAPIVIANYGEYRERIEGYA